MAGLPGVAFAYELVAGLSAYLMPDFTLAKYVRMIQSHSFITSVLLALVYLV